MKGIEEISSINAVIVYGHNIVYCSFTLYILHEVDVWKNFIAVELLVPCMLSIKTTMKNCQTIKR